MTYSKNYDRKEIKLNFDASKVEDLPIGWNEEDNIKVLGIEEYPLDKTYKIIN